MKGGGMQDAYITFKLLKMIWPELIVWKLAKATAAVKGAGGGSQMRIILIYPQNRPKGTR